jgi:hypothetical protein
MQPTFCTPVEYRPDEVLSLAWVHAGALGLVAAMEADRGEMAGAEWSWLRQTAAPLGELAGLSQRLAFAALPEAWAGMARHRAGRSRSLDLLDVMLRGQLSRALIGDPSVRLLAEPVEPQAVGSTVTRDGERLVVEVHATPTAFVRESQFLFVNTITSRGMGAQGFTERRLFARVEVPSDGPGRLGAPEVTVRRGAADVPVLRTTVRHEVWGGKRFVVLQVEAADAALVSSDTRARFSFPVR